MGIAPSYAVYDKGNGLVYVANGGLSRNVSIISGTRAVGSVVIGGIGTNPGSEGLTYDPANGHVYVSNENAGNVERD